MQMIQTKKNKVKNKHIFVENIKITSMSKLRLPLASFLNRTRFLTRPWNYKSLSKENSIRNYKFFSYYQI
jgi:hypothetical protein